MSMLVVDFIFTINCGTLFIQFLICVGPNTDSMEYGITKVWFYYTVSAGKFMIFADHLSRNVSPEASKVPTIPDFKLEVSTLELNPSPSKLESIRQETECDPQMLVLKELIIQGWPKDIKQCPLPVEPFWNFRDELSIIDEIVVKGGCIVILLYSGTLS